MNNMVDIDEILLIHNKIVKEFFPSYSTGFTDLFKEVAFRLSAGERVRLSRGKSLLGAVGRDENIEKMCEGVLPLIFDVIKELTPTSLQLKNLIDQINKSKGYHVDRKMRDRIRQHLCYYFKVED